MNGPAPRTILIEMSRSICTSGTYLQYSKGDIVVYFDITLKIYEGI